MVHWDLIRSKTHNVEQEFESLPTLENSLCEFNYIYPALHHTTSYYITLFHHLTMRIRTRRAIARIWVQLSTSASSIPMSHGCVWMLMNLIVISYSVEVFTSFLLKWVDNVWRFRAQIGRFTDENGYFFIFYLLQNRHWCIFISLERFASNFCRCSKKSLVSLLRNKPNEVIVQFIQKFKHLPTVVCLHLLTAEQFWSQRRRWHTKLSSGILNRYKLREIERTWRKNPGPKITQIRHRDEK